MLKVVFPDDISHMVKEHNCLLGWRIEEQGSPCSRITLTSVRINWEVKFCHCSNKIIIKMAEPSVLLIWSWKEYRAKIKVHGHPVKTHRKLKGLYESFERMLCLLMFQG